MKLTALLDSCGLEHHPGPNGDRALVCPDCKKGAATFGYALDDSGEYCLTCRVCEPSGTTRYTEAEFRRAFGNGRAARSDPETPLAPVGPPGTWADLRNVVGPVEWDWPPWAPRGLLTMIVAALGVGKSLVALALARTYITGGPWPDDTPFDDVPGCVLWIETEAGEAVNLERAEQWGLPLDRLLTPYPDPLAAVTLTDPAHRVRIAEAAREGCASAVIVDSLSGGNTRDENSAAMLPVTTWLAHLARDTGKPVYCVHHVRKRKDSDPDPRYGLSLDMVRGHSSICQPARVVWGLDLPGGPTSDTRRLHQLKNNLRRFPEPLGMAVDEEGRVTWGEAPEVPEVASACSDACDWLRRLLDKEPLPAAEVLREAEKAKINTRTLYRAKVKLHVSSPKVGNVWMWSLPVPGGVRE